MVLYPVSKLHDRMKRCSTLNLDIFLYLWAETLCFANLSLFQFQHHPLCLFGEEKKKKKKQS